MTVWRFIVPRALASANAHVVNGNHAATAARYRTFRNVWAADLRACKAANRIPDATGKRLVTITRLMGKGQRPFDYDNLVAGAKPVVDAMKPPANRRGRRTDGASLIVDDGPAYVRVTYEQERSADGRPGTLITVEDVSNGE
jgi:hypothetical protein